MKLVVEERESSALRDLLGRDGDQIVSALAEVEVVRAVRRAVPELVGQAERVVAQISLVELSETIRVRARTLDPATVCSLDAIHLATALEVGDQLDALVTYDVRMGDAAATLGVQVLSPTQR